jgi:hypothetical protein
MHKGGPYLWLLPLGRKEGDIPRAQAAHPSRLYRAVRPRPAAMNKEEQETDEGHAAALGATIEHLVGAHDRSRSILQGESYSSVAGAGKS